MGLNFRQLNCSKTEAILIGTPHQIQSCPITSISFSGQNIPLSSTVTNLGVKMDPQLNLESHIKHLCKTSFFHLKNISKLRSTLTLPDAERLVHAFVSSRLDYCNALLIGIPSKSLQRLQYIQNSAARILMRVRSLAPHLLQDSIQDFPSHTSMHPRQCPSIPQRTPHPKTCHPKPPLLQHQPPRCPQNQPPHHGRPGVLLHSPISMECPPRPPESTTVH